ncbi:acetylornithine aminotransferase [Thelephora terrestris]|uniref:Acetylornithine aminotransferase n=1 Tax=Thelephora terrestris TaxID=56493 RepID=A0A9P6HCH1_9AGAM|nr:acetylornithine aminotransferase [Thelephora terrestris]
MTTTTHLQEVGAKHVTKGLGRVAGDAVMVRGKGSWVEFEDGRRLLDFTTGIGVTNLGHCHPKVSKAAADQCLNLVHCQCSVAYHEPYLKLIEKLLPIMPDPSLDSFFFWNSGSEAVEGALKMARIYTGRKAIITMQGGYHGRTFGAMALTRSKTIFSEGSGPLMPSVFVASFPFWHQLSLPPSASEEEVIQKALYQLDLLFSQQINPQEVAAIVIEPVLGEGGYVPAPPAYLRSLREICDKHGIVLILDEVQSGFGRTGKYFASEHSGVRPDILVIAKGIANGFPLSAIVSRTDITDKLKPGIMGGTYAGNAVACAAAIACADVMKEERVLENVQQRSHELIGSLNQLRSRADVGPYILDVRGLGLMIGVEFASPSPISVYDPNTLAGAPKSLASRVAKRCLEKGVLILTTSIYEVVRFIPPLNISAEEMAKGIEIFTQAVEEVVKEG